MKALWRDARRSVLRYHFHSQRNHAAPTSTGGLWGDTIHHPGACYKVAVHRHCSRVITEAASRSRRLQVWLLAYEANRYGGGRLGVVVIHQESEMKLGGNLDESAHITRGIKWITGVCRQQFRRRAQEDASGSDNRQTSWMPNLHASFTIIRRPLVSECDDDKVALFDACGE